MSTSGFDRDVGWPVRARPTSDGDHPSNRRRAALTRCKLDRAPARVAHQDRGPNRFRGREQQFTAVKPPGYLDNREDHRIAQHVCRRSFDTLHLQASDQPTIWQAFGTHAPVGAVPTSQAGAHG